MVLRLLQSRGEYREGRYKLNPSVNLRVLGARGVREFRDDRRSVLCGVRVGMSVGCAVRDEGLGMRVVVW